MMAFQFDPTDGLLNGNVFPTVPESETAARQQFQTLLNQIRDAINAHLAENAAKHITESGSNSNGRYVKYDDGTQICYIQRVITGTGERFYDIDSSTFPATFADPSTIRVLVEVYNNHNGHSPADGCAMTYGFPVSTTMYHAGCKFPDSNGVPDHRQVYIFIVAIGRWK